MRRRFQFDPLTERMVEVTSQTRELRPYTIFGDIEPFKSTVDGTIINSRSDLRQHMKRHNLAHSDDFKGEWAAKAAKRRLVLSGKDPEQRAARIDGLRWAYEAERNKLR